MVKKRSLKKREVPPRLGGEALEFFKIIEQVMVVSSLPSALYEKHRNSGKSVEEVYREITANN